MAATNTTLANTGNTNVEQTDASKSTSGTINVGEAERYASAIGGGALALYGLSRKSLGGLALGLIGAALVYRGTTGHCNMYGALGINTARDGKTKDNKAKGLLGGRGTRVVKSITINRPRAELYSFWRNFENLPQFMNHLESVKVIDDKRSHWVAKAPAGTTVEWDAEIVRERENRLIAWRSLEGADVENAGTVRFERKPHNQTDIIVAIEYIPPGGVLGTMVAKLFGEEPEQQLEDDLNRFKDVVEKGEALPQNTQTSSAV